MALNIDDNNAHSIIDSGEPVVIDFWAEWCGPCRTISPIIEQLATEYEGKVTIAKCDVTEATDLCNEFGIISIPTILFFKDGKKVDSLSGGVQRAKIEEKINALL
ncbi:MAG: thioredoxin [Muribaculaceae bacterium]|nr:thioredoxin [Muribaculaceae bacterium]